MFASVVDNNEGSDIEHNMSRQKLIKNHRKLVKFCNTIRTSFMSIYMGFRLEINGVFWYFKDSAQARFGHPYIWYARFFQNRTFHSNI